VRGLDVALPRFDGFGVLLDLRVHDAEAVEGKDVVGLELQRLLVLLDRDGGVALALGELAGGVARLDVDRRLLLGVERRLRRGRLLRRRRAVVRALALRAATRGRQNGNH
jgi:hypothetical protein